MEATSSCFAALCVSTLYFAVCFRTADVPTREVPRPPVTRATALFSSSTKLLTGAPPYKKSSPSAPKSLLT